MSAFWRYFRDTLAWPLIHRPGVLQSLVKGLGQSLDGVREDALYFRKQWFPALCEGKLVPAHGTSRGLTRHPKESAEQFRTRVVQAYRWHLLGGRTLGLPEILRFYGFDSLAVENLRNFQPSRWAEFQVRLKTPTSHDELNNLLADLDVLIWLVNEYKAARSLFARLYTSNYDWFPGVWSGGAPEYVWSNFWWSLFSGVRVDDSDLIVSIGYPDRYQVEPYIADDGGALYGMLQSHAFRIPYVDRAFWSWSNWGDTYPVNSSFIIGQILILLCADYVYESSGWTGDWDSRIWGYRRIDRYHPDWMMGFHFFAKSELVFSERHADGGVYGDINSSYSTPIVYLLDGKTPIWGDLVWSADKSRIQIQRILEQFKVDGRYQAAQEELLQQAFCARTDSFASNGVYPDHPIWGRFDYSDTFPRLHEFVRSDLSAYLAAEKVLSSRTWADIWDERPWGDVLGYERIQRDFSFWARNASKSQLIHAEPHADGSRYGDINSCYSRPVAINFPEPPKYSVFRYSETEALSVVATDEQFAVNMSVQLEEDGVAENVETARHDLLSSLGVCSDHPIWGRFAYSDVFPHQHGFGRLDLAAYLAAERLYSDKSWDDVWGESPWAEVVGYGRKDKDSQLTVRSHLKSQLVHNEPHEDGSCFGDINSCYSVPYVKSYPAPPKYSVFAWSDVISEITCDVIEEQFSQTITLSAGQHEFGRPASALGRIHGAESEKIHAEGWAEGWNDRYWRGWHGYTQITDAALVEDLHYILHVLASGVTNIPGDLPVSNYPTLHAILHGLMEGVTLVHVFDDTALQRFFEIAGGCTNIPEDTWESCDD